MYRGDGKFPGPDEKLLHQEIKSPAMKVVAKVPAGHPQKAKDREVGANRLVSVFVRLLAGASGPPCFFLRFFSSPLLRFYLSLPMALVAKIFLS